MKLFSTPASLRASDADLHSVLTNCVGKALCSGALFKYLYLSTLRVASKRLFSSSGSFSNCTFCSALGEVPGRTFLIRFKADVGVFGTAASEMGVLKIGVECDSGWKGVKPAYADALGDFVKKNF